MLRGFIMWVSFVLAIVVVVAYWLLTTMANPDVEARNKQVLVDTFYHLVCFPLLRSYRDLEMLGVTQGSFSVDALNSSLSARANAEIFAGHMTPTIKMLLQKARKPDLIFHFYWTLPTAREPLEGVFGISYVPSGDLKVRLLWLGLPERIPISPQAGVIDGRKPLEESVHTLVRVLKHGQLEPYPPPQ